MLLSRVYETKLTYPIDRIEDEMRRTQSKSPDTTIVS